jgi:hypothetical protein
VNQSLDTDASLAEVNPLMVTGGGDVMALDAKMSFDNNRYIDRRFSCGARWTIGDVGPGGGGESSGGGGNRPVGRGNVPIGTQNGKRTGRAWVGGGEGSPSG